MNQGQISAVKRLKRCVEHLINSRRQERDPANGWEAAESCLVICCVSTGVRGGSSEAAMALVSKLHGRHFMKSGLVGARSEVCSQNWFDSEQEQ